MKIMCKYGNLEIELENIIELNEYSNINYIDIIEDPEIERVRENFLNNKKSFTIEAWNIKKAILNENLIIDDIKLFKGDPIGFDIFGEIEYDDSNPKLEQPSDIISTFDENTKRNRLVSMEPAKYSYYEDGGKFLGYHRREARKWGSLPIYDDYDDGDDNPTFPFCLDKL